MSSADSPTGSSPISSVVVSVSGLGGLLLLDLLGLLDLLDFVGHTPSFRDLTVLPR